MEWIDLAEDGEEEAGPQEQSIEPLISIQCGEFLDKMRNY
jgi:hypothetical protein